MNTVLVCGGWHCCLKILNMLWAILYGDIFLPPVCKRKYAIIKKSYINMQDDYIYMQDNNVGMQYFNILRESGFYG